MTRMVRLVVLAMALAGLLGGALGSADQAEAANGYEQWQEGFADGCSYYWDGYGYAAKVCPQNASIYNFYFPGYDGQWVYSFSAGYWADGSFWLLYDGTVYSYATPSNVTFGTSSFGGVTDNAIVAEIVSDGADRAIDRSLSTNCAEITVDGVCLHW